MDVSIKNMIMKNKMTEQKTEVRTLKSILIETLNKYTKEMEGYCYFTSNEGVSVDDYEDIVDEALAEAEKAVRSFSIEDIENEIIPWLIGNYHYLDKKLWQQKKKELLGDAK